MKIPPASSAPSRARTSTWPCCCRSSRRPPSTWARTSVSPAARAGGGTRRSSSSPTSSSSCAFTWKPVGGACATCVTCVASWRASARALEGSRAAGRAGAMRLTRSVAHSAPSRVFPWGAGPLEAAGVLAFAWGRRGTYCSRPGGPHFGLLEGGGAGTAPDPGIGRRGRRPAPGAGREPASAAAVRPRPGRAREGPLPLRAGAELGGLRTLTQLAGRRRFEQGRLRGGARPREGGPRDGPPSVSARRTSRWRAAIG